MVRGTGSIEPRARNENPMRGTEGPCAEGCAERSTERSWSSPPPPPPAFGPRVRAKRARVKTDLPRAEDRATQATEVAIAAGTTAKHFVRMVAGHSSDPPA